MEGSRVQKRRSARIVFSKRTIYGPQSSSDPSSPVDIPDIDYGEIAGPTQEPQHHRIQSQAEKWDMTQALIEDYFDHSKWEVGVSDNI